MSSNIRRGRTWQDGDWRRVPSSEDLADRARAAFSKLRRAASARYDAPRPLSHDCARMVAPFMGDGLPVDGPFVIRPEYRGFP